MSDPYYTRGAQALVCRECGRESDAKLLYFSYDGEQALYFCSLACDDAYMLRRISEGLRSFDADLEPPEVDC